MSNPESPTFDAVLAWLASPERTEGELEHLQHVIATFMIVGSLGGESEKDGWEPLSRLERVDP